MLRFFHKKDNFTENGALIAENLGSCTPKDVKKGINNRMTWTSLRLN